jgi:hypothetical protein
MFMPFGGVPVLVAMLIMVIVIMSVLVMSMAVTAVRMFMLFFMGVIV